MWQKNNIYLLGLVLCVLTGCSTVLKKEDAFLQAQKIKTAEAIKTVYMTAAQPPVPATGPQQPQPPIIPIEIPILKPGAFPLPTTSVVQERLSKPEKLVYKSKFLGIAIGEFITTNRGRVLLDNKPAYCFEIDVKIISFFTKIFKTKEKYVSYIDPRTFVILRHEEYIKDGVLESTTDFDYNNRTAIYKNFINITEKKVVIPAKITDVIAGAFYLRTISWEVGDTQDIQLYADEKIYNLVGLIHSKTKLGEQDVTVFKPYVFFNGKQMTRISAEVYFSTTEEKVPLRAILKTPLGNVTVILTETETNEKT